MGRSVGIEPTHAGATIQCVNHFTTTAILYFLDLRKYAIAYFPSQVCFNRQLPILPGRLQPSTFGVYVLNYCVRNGNRWVHIAIITGYSSLSFSSMALLHPEEKILRYSFENTYVPSAVNICQSYFAFAGILGMFWHGVH